LNRLRVSLSYVFVFLTGATALVYEVVWQRYVERLTGNDSLATALILGIFLAGLSAGYALCGWLSRRFENSGRIYAVLEAIIGFWGILFPPLFAAVSGVTRPWSFAPPGWLLAQGSICTLVLIGLPTLCMGGTVPLLTRVLAKSLGGATSVHARLYGTNTAGAFAGVLSAGYVLVPGLGLPGSLRTAAFINLLAALFFAWSSRRLDNTAPAETISPQESPPAAQSNPRLFPTWILYAIAALNGAAVMALENVMIRVANLTLGSSAYSFSLLVAVFVLSLACGSYAVGSLRRIPRALLFGTQTSALAGWCLVFVSLEDWPYFAHVLRAAFQSNGPGFWLFQAATLAVLLAVLIVPVGLLGATLPVIFHELKRDLRLVGWHSGRMFSANAAGCVVGSMVFGWLLFYPLDNPGVMACGLGLVALSAMLAAWPLGQFPRIGAWAVLAATAVFCWRQPHFDKTRFAHGTFGLDQMTPFSYRGPEYFFDNFQRGRQVKFYDDCPEGTVAVIADAARPEAAADLAQLLPGMPPPIEDAAAPANPPLAIMVNGKPDSHTKYDRTTLKLSADIPALWSAHPTKAMVIGLGTGVTAGELSLYPEVKTIDVAELSSGVIKALPIFASFTHDVQNDPRLHIHPGDAFRVLGRSQEKWDIIISEPSNPWVTGVDMLFSREFYQLAREHLTDGGLLLQWIQKYAIDPQTFSILINTVRSEFPHCCIYQGEPGDLLVLASRRAFTPGDQQRAESVLQKNPAVQASLADIDIHSFAELRQHERMGLSVIADQLKNSGIETLDRPRVYYRAARSRFVGAGLEDLARDPSAPGTLILSSSLFRDTLEMHLQTNAPPHMD
jgi:spermidine synthase